MDFPTAFVGQWLPARTKAPMFITAMGTNPEGNAHWACEKGGAEFVFDESYLKHGFGQPMALESHIMQVVNSKTGFVVEFQAFDRALL